MAECRISMAEVSFQRRREVSRPEATRTGLGGAELGSLFHFRTP